APQAEVAQRVVNRRGAVRGSVRRRAVPDRCTGAELTAALLVSASVADDISLLHERKIVTVRRWSGLRTATAAIAGAQARAGGSARTLGATSSKREAAEEESDKTDPERSHGSPSRRAIRRCSDKEALLPTTERCLVLLFYIAACIGAAGRVA